MLSNNISSQPFEHKREIKKQSNVPVHQEEDLTNFVPFIKELSEEVKSDFKKYSEYYRINLLCLAILTSSPELVESTASLNDNYELISDIDVNFLCQKLDESYKEEVKKILEKRINSLKKKEWDPMFLSTAEPSEQKVERKIYAPTKTFNLDTLPTAWHEKVSTYLDKKSLNNLSLTSKHYRKKITESLVLLREDFIKAGFNRATVSQIRKVTFVKNNQKAYERIINFYDPRLTTFLMQPIVAALSGDVEAIQHQISIYSYTHPEKRFKGDIVPWNLLLHAAAMSRSVEAIKYIINSEKVNKQCIDRDGKNILHSAAMSGSIEVMDFVISLGIDINSKDHGKRNILHYAAWSGSIEAVEWVRLLIHDYNLNIDPNLIDVDSLRWNQRENEKEPVKNALKMPIKDLLLKRSLKQKNVDQSLINNFFSELKRYREKYGTENPDIKQTVTLLEKATTEPLKVTSQEFLTLAERLLGSRSTQAVGVTFMLIGFSLCITAVIAPFLSVGVSVLGVISTPLILIALGLVLAGPIGAAAIYKGYGLYEAGGEKRSLASSLNKIQSSLLSQHNSEKKSQAKVTSRVDQPFPQTPLDATPHPFSQGNQRSKIK